MCETNNDKQREELLTLWSTYSSYCEEITNKRQIINAFFLGIISTLIGCITGIWGTLGLVLSLIGLVITVFWAMYIISYKKLNAAKFDVLIGIEKKLGINIYALEWEKVKEQKYIRLTTIELFLVIIFAISFIALLIISILKLKGCL